MVFSLRTVIYEELVSRGPAASRISRLMQDKAIRGVPWTLLSYAGAKVVSILTTLVLARLIAPADFGVLALATLAANFLNWIADMGFSGAVVLRQRPEPPRRLGTLLTLMAITGLTAGLIAVALARRWPPTCSRPRS